MNKETLQEWKQTLLQEIEDLKARLAPIETEIRVKQEKLVAIDRLLNLETQPFEVIPALKNNSAARTTGKRKTADVAYVITQNQLSWLLAGLDFQLMNEFNALNFTHYF